MKLWHSPRTPKVEGIQDDLLHDLLLEEALLKNLLLESPLLERLLLASSLFVCLTLDFLFAFFRFSSHVFLVRFRKFLCVVYCVRHLIVPDNLAAGQLQTKTVDSIR